MTDTAQTLHQNVATRVNRHVLAGVVVTVSLGAIVFLFVPGAEERVLLGFEKLHQAIAIMAAWCR